MDKITLRNFRCFGEEQTARLAPLTLLVGENSTGKTSFMAMIRALWDIAYRDRIPDFKEAPYDLGSFEEIVHHRGIRNGRADTFEASFYSTIRRDGKLKRSKIDTDQTYCFEVTFAKDGTVPVPVQRRLVREDLWIDEFMEMENRNWQLRIGTNRGSWGVQGELDPNTPLDITHYMIRPLLYSLMTAGMADENKFAPLDGSKEIAEKDLEQIYNFCGRVLKNPVRATRPYASAPVRSKPRRTYDPTRLSSDPEGDYVPMYLANVYVRHKQVWETLKNKLEKFGQSSGLFHEITVKHLGKTLGSPFQLQVRKFAGRRRGLWRNLVDVGYGVSQVLPVITELLRQDAPPLVLLQQPEVHLHPSAQAALGGLFCQVAARGNQLVVETHSDYILDRVRMDVRDGTVRLKPDDVSILFFERTEQGVCIHSLGMDKEGNISGDVPPNYRSFFMEETQRSLGL